MLTTKNPNPRHLTQLAAKVRGWAELEMAKARPLFSPGLFGMCAICSARIHTRLKAHGLPSQLIEGDAHVFVLSGPWLVDVTATQFTPRLPRVLVTHYVRGFPYLVPPKLQPHWAIYQRHDSLASLHQSQLDTDWPEEQRLPPSYLTTRNLAFR